jgi:hypothetical protein
MKRIYFSSVILLYSLCTVAQSLPTVSTTTPSSVTQTNAVGGGDVTSNGGATVTSKGVCWGTSANPTINVAHTMDGPGNGVYSTAVEGLSPSTTYHIRAYATNSVGTSYGSDLSFTTPAAGKPTVTTTQASSITQSSASSGGNVVSSGGVNVTARGVCWSTSANPTTSGYKTTNGSGTGSFVSSITSLTGGTTYHYRAYATNSYGTNYGSDLTFTTNPVVPTITTTTVSSISQTSASSGGNITFSGGADITARGVCWNTSANPTTSNSKTTDGTGTGTFSSSITGLLPSTTYYLRAYATNSVGTNYGSDVSFTTLNPVAPTVSTVSASSITLTTATTGGNISFDGGAEITERGVCWGTSTDPTTSNSKTTDGTGTGTYSSSVTGLVPSTTYHFRAYATNNIGTSYGSDLTLTTASPVAPTISTVAASTITLTAATTGGNISADGGASVTTRGVCWNTTANPTTSGSKTTNGTGTGSFSSSITGLTPTTTYHIRAYATNSAGTNYGSDMTFTTMSPSIPTITTIQASQILLTGATAGGNVTSDGGVTLSARGVCWGTTANPTIANNKTIDGTGNGTFSSSVNGLLPGTTYHIRAYAANIAGTGYGSDLSFTTNSPLLATISTVTPDSITQTTASSGGNISSDGGAVISARGVCWSTSVNPTISNWKTINGTGAGVFTSSLSGLVPNMVYHLRAYATNSVGTCYGNDETFITLEAPSAWLKNANNIYYLKGNVGIAVNNPTTTLSVDGKILASEVETNSDITADFVFESGYKLMPLPALKYYLSDYKHLPEVPSTIESSNSGQNLSKTDDLLLRKIEELTLYIIEQQKKIEALQSEIESMKNNLNK